MSETVRIVEVTDDLGIVADIGGKERTLKLCGIVPKESAKGYIEDAIAGKSVPVVRHGGKLADVFVPKDGGEIYLNGILVLEGLATVDVHISKILL
ncbi:MAG: hypothetical protein J7647_32200 [Cyanobacteria bacterium SBLK]|nr:hypothetical protein [Cyanobacteria bacterium SBLK]